MQASLRKVNAAGLELWKAWFQETSVHCTIRSLSTSVNWNEAIEQLVADKLAEKKGNEYHIDLAKLGIEKVLEPEMCQNPFYYSI